MYEIKYAEGWDEHFSHFDKATKERILKKISKLKEKTSARHLGGGAPYFVEETGQYRICFKEEGTMRRIAFVGTHKQYEKWYKQFF
jgi:mRNA-degrading endonuclease RelE of RelBE toxin-antitoxin system